MPYEIDRRDAPSRATGRLGACSRAIVAAVLAAGVVALASRSDAAGADADDRARRLVAQMSLAEKLSLVRTSYGLPLQAHPKPDGALDSAGFGIGLPRLGIPPLEETDAGLGVANPTNADYDATAMPSMLSMGATFDPDLAQAAGAAIGAEARAYGFSVLLGGGADLVREPRGGRNFEYVGEDPLLTGVIAGAEVAGVQSNRIISTLKHFALNDQENGRVVLNAKLAEAPARESDLLAFEIALERGHPGAIMCSYNKVDGVYSSQSKALIADALKGDWGFTGWVMSDWGGLHASAEAALAGLDQESGQEDDAEVYFGASLEAAIAAGRVPMARLDDMVMRILRTRIAAGVLDDPPRRGAPADLEAHARVAETAAERGIVLLKNDGGVLPLASSLRHVLVVGGHADVGVLSGGGSSQVVPKGGIRFEGVPPQLFYGKPRLFDPSSPLAALRRKVPGTTFDFVDGRDREALARAARGADAVVVFADRWGNESLDLTDLALSDGQDALVAAAAAANPRTVVVLETTGAEAMPWLGAVAGVIEAWYPGERGGEAIADILLGNVNPAGRLPVSIPASVDQLPRPNLPDHAKTVSYPRGAIRGSSFDVDYDIEGADVGYKWYLRTHRRPLFPFGYGLSYTRFLTSGLAARLAGGALHIDFDVRNDGAREGTDTPQVYLEGGPFTRRLAGWGRVTLKAGETKHVGLVVDPRITASFDVAAHGWRVDPGRYVVSVRENALGDGASVSLDLPARAWPARQGGAPSAVPPATGLAGDLPKP